MLTGLEECGGDSSGYLGGCSGVLEITLLRATDLCLTEEEGVNDSYCEFVDNNGVVVNTTSVVESLSPDWSALAPDVARNTARFRIRPGDEMKGSVSLLFWDEDPFGRDFNGEARIEVGKAIRAVQGEAEVPLQPRKGETDPVIAGKGVGELGTCCYQFSWRPSATNAAAKEAEEAAKKQVRDNPLPGLGVTMQEVERRQWLPCAFRFNIRNARWLLNRDVVGLSDPYVTILNGAGAEVMRTPVIDETLCPDWSNMRCEGLVHVKDVAQTRGDITLQVWDADTSSSDFLGQVSIPIANLMAKCATNDDEPTEYSCVAMLQRRVNEKDRVVLAKDFLGALHFSYQMLSISDIEQYEQKGDVSESVSLPRSLAPATPFMVTVSLKRCSYLAARNAMDLPNPYVTVHRSTAAGGDVLPYGPCIYRTACRPHTVSPVCNDSFTAFISMEGVDSLDRINRSALADTFLTFLVMNKCKPNAVGNDSGDEPIGAFTLSLLQLLQRMQYAMVEEGQEAYGVADRAVGVRLVHGGEMAAFAAQTPSRRANREGGGGGGVLYLWAAVSLPTPAALPLSECLPHRPFSSFRVVVLRCEGLVNAKTKVAQTGTTKAMDTFRPFVRVFLNERKAGGGSGAEVLRTISAEGSNPKFGTRGGRSEAIAILRADNGLAEGNEAPFTNTLLTFDVVDENPFGDTVLGSCTVSLKLLSQHVTQNTLCGSGTESIALHLIDAEALTKKRYKQRSLGDRADVLGSGRGGRICVWLLFE